MTRTVRVVVVVGIVVGVVGLGVAAERRGSHRSSAVVTRPTAISEEGARTGSAVGEVVPSLAIETIDAATFRVPAGKPTVLYFMAGWCETCLPEARALARIDSSVGDRVAILAIDADPTEAASSLRAFAKDVGSPRYGFAQDDGQLVRTLAARTLDTTLVLDGRGKVVYRDAVPTDEATLRSALLRAGLRE